MRIKKKSGRIEDFNIEKIKTSIINSATDINMTINNADINLITRDVVSECNSLRTSLLSSQHLRVIIYLSLKKFGFAKLAENYLNR